jgi:cytochrome oxidase Cu insertion factor (SCO1/SenC/PrrC family)
VNSEPNNVIALCGQSDYEKESRMLKTFSAIILALFVSYAPAYGQLGLKDGSSLPPTDLKRVKVGDKAPDFTLEAMDGQKISLSEFRGRKSVVLVFYRGHW